MDFFNNHSFSESSLSIGNFREWANIVANSYLADGIAPSTSITKLAQSESLTPHQIEVLSGETNKVIHQHKYASADDKYHAANFPLADAKDIIAGLQVDGGQQKIATVMPEPVFEGKADIDVFSAFGVKEEGISKLAHLKHEVVNSNQKIASVNQKLNDKIVLGEFQKEASEKKFIKTARQLIIQDSNNQNERIEKLGQINSFFKNSDLNELAKPLLAKVAGVLMHEGLIDRSNAKGVIGYFMGKTADEKAPSGLISANLKARVINGNHPLYITLKTFKSRSAALDNDRARKTIVEDKLNISGQYVRSL